MPDNRHVVINTGPILALTAALGDLQILNDLYEEVHVPAEVCHEIMVGGTNGFGVQQFIDATWLTKWEFNQKIPPFLENSLDKGEASVVQLALAEKIATVCIDEAVGRRIGRLNGLDLTGSIGVLLRAKREGLVANIGDSLIRMHKNGIWLSDRVINFAIQQAGENPISKS